MVALPFCRSSSRLSRWRLPATLGGPIIAAAFAAGAGTAAATRWAVDDPRTVGTHAASVLGAPVRVVIDGVRCLQFDGADDGLIVPHNPLQGLTAFTVEVLFHPASEGPAEQRFVHFEDLTLNRALIETRVTTDKQWYLDTFLFSAPAQKGLTLVDRGQRHACDRWYWAALVYDGTVMAHFVDGKKEKEGVIGFGPMTDGRTSLGVRLNQVHWFKGGIAELRIHSRALLVSELQKRGESARAAAP